MQGRSRLWLFSAVLLAAGAGFHAAAVTDFWRPCAGTMLTGSIFNGYSYEPAFSDVCLETMDQGLIFPLPVAGQGWTAAGTWGAVAVVLLGLAWLVIVPVLQVPWAIRLVATLPGLATIGIAVNAVLLSLGPEVVDDPVGKGLVQFLELGALAVVLMLGAAGVTPWLLVRCAVVLFGATGAGFVHQMSDYIVAVSLSDANWDTPPGAGYPSALAVLLAAAATVVLWWLDGRAAAAPSMRTAAATGTA